MKKNKKNKSNIKWIITITTLAFIISIIFSLLSEVVMPNVNIIIGIIIMLLFIFIGILFDMIGIAVTASLEAPFNSMSARKIKGAKVAVKLKKNASKVSSFCNDVIGDICGIISGSAGVYIASKLAIIFNLNIIFISLLITGFISAITIGGKALFKNIAINNSTTILFTFSKVLSSFYINNK